jgi:predicted AAA+ superfamily ATPase
VPISERDVRSYKEVLSEGEAEQTYLLVSFGLEDYFEKLSFDIEEEDYAWLKRCLLGKIKKRIQLLFYMFWTAPI